uniref:VWFD domain-containing protein n=1 Tax=Leptobrachium leishanense TaxID=445787 RepID=A0A8C5R7C1_9ANUR
MAGFKLIYEKVNSYALILLECKCEYERHIYKINETIYNTTDGIGNCMVAICKENGTIYRNVYPCATSPTPPFTFTKVSSTAPTVITTMTSTICEVEECVWSEWIDVYTPETGAESGDFETYGTISLRGIPICKNPKQIICGVKKDSGFVIIDKAEQNIKCDVAFGLTCYNKYQDPRNPICYDYAIKVLCCKLKPCPPTMGTSTERSSTPFVTTTSVTTKKTTLETTRSQPVTTTSTYRTTTPATKTTFSSTSATTIKSTSESTTSRPATTGSTYRTTTPATKTTFSSVTSLTSSTACQPKCRWTEWFNQNRVSVGINGGDTENYNDLINKGKKICRDPKDIDCRAQGFEVMTIAQLKQNVVCDLINGLICKNANQVSNSRMCYDFMIKFLCCDDYSHCFTTSAPTSTGKTTFSSTSTRTTIKSTLETSTSRPVTTGSTYRSTTPATKTTFSSVTSLTPSTACQPKCRWTEWFNQNRVSIGVNGGDTENYNDLIRKGKQICRDPKDIDCRAQGFEDMTIEQVKQNVVCDLINGLICKNANQFSNSRMCYDFMIKFLCCDDYSHCFTTSAPTSTGKTTFSSTSATTIKSTSETSTSRPVTTGSTYRTTTPATKTAFSSVTSLTSSTACQPKCKWTEWFNQNRVSIGNNGGDTENYNDLIRKGKQICRDPKDIDCRAQGFEYMTMEQLKQNVVCDLINGLICKNVNQVSNSRMCYDFMIKFLCCNDYSHCFTTSAPTSTGKTTFSSTSATTIKSTLETSTSRPVTTGSTYRTTTPATKTTFSSVTSLTPSTACQPKCRWTEWFNQNRVSIGVNGGDTENYNDLIRKGKQICRDPKDIDCRAQGFEDMTIEQVKQNVVCDLINGLICKNANQFSNSRMCYDFMIKFLCCDDYSHCFTTSAPTSTGKTTFSSTSATTIKSTSETSTSRPVTTGSTYRTTTPATKTTFSSVTSLTSSTACQPKCRWTEWFNQNRVSVGINGGDTENYNDLIKKGKKICRDPKDIDCRAQGFEDMTIAQLKQNVLCDLSNGLICKNANQVSNSRMCYEFMIKFLCCDDYSHCFTTSAPTSTGKTTFSSTSATTIKSTLETSTSRPVTTGSTYRTTTPATKTTFSSMTSLTPSTACQPKCRWTEWFNQNRVSIGVNGGDTENYYDLIRKGKQICRDPKDIDCRAQGFEDMTIAQLKQNVVCDLINGLICKNANQVSNSRMCYDFIIKFLCCDDYSHCFTTSAPTSTGKTTFSSTSATTIKSTSQTSTSRPVTTGSTYRTTTPATKTTFSSVTSLTPSTACQPKCRWTEWFNQNRVSVGINGGDTENYNDLIKKGKKICQDPKDIDCRAQGFEVMTIAQLKQNVVCDLINGLICKNANQVSNSRMCYDFMIKFLCCDDYSHCFTTSAPTSTGKTTFSSTSATTIKSTSETSTSRPVTTGSTYRTTTPATKTTFSSVTSLTSSTACQPKCRWTEWFNQNRVSVGINGGDTENYNDLIIKGKKICWDPKDIDCRAQGFEVMTIAQLKQNVVCDLINGLICKNANQVSNSRMCYDFMIKFLCCDDYSHCFTTSAPTSTGKTTFSSTSTRTTPFTTTPTSTLCRCNVNGAIFHPGDIIYGGTDATGCSFYTICNQRCRVEAIVGTCRTTSTPHTSTSTSRKSTPSTTVLSTATTIEGCPPRKVGESWRSDNCTVSTCLGNNLVNISAVKCKIPVNIKCANGLLSNRVYDADGCCFTYECSCVCGGYEDFTFVTFDGTIFKNENLCPQILVEQINKTYDDFKIFFENRYCKNLTSSNCLRILSVYYEGNIINLTSSINHADKTMLNEIIFNGNPVSSGFTKDGIKVVDTGITMLVHIPAIEAQISFSGTVHLIKLPFNKFSNNTEGLCGMCSGFFYILASFALVFQKS